MLLHLLIRLALILAGYALATVFSGVGVGIVFHAAENMGGPQPEDPFAIIAFAIMLIGIYAAAPALVAVAIGEAASIRRKLYYIAAACLIGMALPVLVGLDRWYILVGLGLGPIAGMIYWIIAGRRAGLRREAPA